MASALESYVAPGALIAEKYRVERALGMGGMGVVVAAVHVALGQRVAIKTLRMSPRRDDAVARFEREAMVAASLASEHVARVFDLGALPDGSPYMVMEYLEGMDLRRLIADRGPIRIEDALTYVAQACEAVGLAHAQGIVHRDLTPGNLFLVKRPHAGPAATPMVKVLDFGIAQIGPDPSRRALTATGLFLGSPLYAAPEQLRSARSATPRSDVWSLGAVLYELLTGVPPFSGQTIPEMCAQVMLADPRPVRELRPDVGPRLASVLETCLKKKPEGRFPDASALGHALHAARREIVLGSMDTVRAAAPPPSSSRVRAVWSDAPVALPTQVSASPIERKGQMRALVVAGASALALGAILSFSFRGEPGTKVAAAETRAAAMGGELQKAQPGAPPVALSVMSAVVTTATAVSPPETVAAQANPPASQPAGADAQETPARDTANPGLAGAHKRGGDGAAAAGRDAGVVEPAAPAAPRAEAWPWGERK